MLGFFKKHKMPHCTLSVHCAIAGLLGARPGTCRLKTIFVTYV